MFFRGSDYNACRYNLYVLKFQCIRMSIQTNHLGEARVFGVGGLECLGWRGAGMFGGMGGLECLGGGSWSILGWGVGGN